MGSIPGVNSRGYDRERFGEKPHGFQIFLDEHRSPTDKEMEEEEEEEEYKE